MLADQVGAETAKAKRRDVDPAFAGVPRSVALIVGCIVLFALIALVGTELISGDVREEAVIGLTEDSEWPFHDVHMATAASRLDDPSLVTDLQAELGLMADPNAVSLARERKSGDGVLVVWAEAASGAQAAALVNAVADEMVAGDDLPLFVVDRANGRAEPVGRASALGAGALVGLLIGLVAAPRRRVDRA